MNKNPETTDTYYKRYPELQALASESSYIIGSENTTTMSQAPGRSH